MSCKNLPEIRINKTEPCSLQNRANVIQAGAGSSDQGTKRFKCRCRARLFQSRSRRFVHIFLSFALSEGLSTPESVFESRREASAAQTLGVNKPLGARRPRGQASGRRPSWKHRAGARGAGGVPGESRQMAISSTCSSSCRLSFFKPTWNLTSGSSSSRV